MKRLIFTTIIAICFYQTPLSAQNKTPQLVLTSNTPAFLASIKANAKINADSAYKLLKDFNTYAAVQSTGTNYKYFYTDAYFGKVPVQVYIPAGYKPSKPTPCIMMLHGAVGMSKFSDIDSAAATDEDIMFDILKKEDYIIIRPLGDSKKKFDWVVNRFGTWREQHANLTYKALNNILTSLKSLLNIDDNRVYAFGHSDGSDGAAGLAVYSPDAYAGVVGYNSMLNNLSTRDFFIKNIINRPAYLVHSELDDLRPMRMTREIVTQLKAAGARVTYKEYMGYQHYDKHLTIDLPFAIKYMSGIKRDPHQSILEWTTASDTIYNACNWLIVTKTDAGRTKAGWDTEFNLKAYDKTTGGYFPMNYYPYVDNAVTVKAKYSANVFDIQTSCVGEVELLISPAMVDLKKPVTVIVNGNKVFNGIVEKDKNFLLNNFSNTMDRQALWVSSLKVNVK